MDSESDRRQRMAADAYMLLTAGMMGKPESFGVSKASGGNSHAAANREGVAAYNERRAHDPRQLPLL